MAFTFGAVLRRDRRLGIPVRAAVPVGRMLTSLTGVAVAADGQLPSKQLQKAAVTCQKVIPTVSGKAVGAKLKALDTCANAALSCVQTNQDDANCFTKAG